MGGDGEEFLLVGLLFSVELEKAFLEHKDQILGERVVCLLLVPGGEAGVNGHANFIEINVNIM